MTASESIFFRSNLVISGLSWFRVTTVYHSNYHGIRHSQFNGPHGLLPWIPMKKPFHHLQMQLITRVMRHIMHSESMVFVLATVFMSLKVIHPVQQPRLESIIPAINLDNTILKHKVGVQHHEKQIAFLSSLSIKRTINGC